LNSNNLSKDRREVGGEQEQKQFPAELIAGYKTALFKEQSDNVRRDVGRDFTKHDARIMREPMPGKPNRWIA